MSQQQHGFTRNKSTQTAIICLINQIEHKAAPIAIFCDLSKAFDCVNYALLVSKLQVYRIRENVSDWRVSYLTERCQFVKITYNVNGSLHTCKSSILPINIGVPEGSILSPILFNLFLNDITEFLSDYFIITYADDTTATAEGNDDALESKANAPTRNIHLWFTSNKLCLNKYKTKYIFFSMSQKIVTNNVDIYINDNKIEKTLFKLLGLIVQEMGGQHEQSYCEAK